MPVTVPSPGPTATRNITPGQPVLYIDNYPFLPNQQMVAWSPAANTLYGAAMQARNNGKVFVATLAANLGAAEVDIALSTAVPLAASAAVDADVDTALTPPAQPGQVLRVVVIRDRDGIALRRRGTDVADGSLSASSFKVKTSAANGNVIRIRGPASGQFNQGETFTIIVLEASDIVTVTGASLNAFRTANDVVYSLMYAGLAANDEINIRAELST